LVTAKEIPPGGVGEIKATFRSKGAQGKIKKAITVQTNDPRNKTVRLSIAGEVVTDVMVTPRYLNFKNVDKGNLPDPLQLEVKVREGAGLKIEEVKVDNPYILLEEKKRSETNATYAVSLADNVPIGRVAGKVHVLSNSKKNPRMQVHCYAFVQGSVRLSPQVVSFGVIRPGEPSSREITLSGKQGNAFTVDKVSASTDAMTTEILTDEEGARYRVRVTYDPGENTKGRVSERLTIVVKGREVETLAIPVYGNIHQLPVKRQSP
jgi:hypothetical protein